MKIRYLASTLLIFALVSAGTDKKPVTSLKDMKKMMEKGYSFIPSGVTLVERDTVSCQGFFMMKGEVTNFHYLEYLYALKNANQTEAYNAALPDTTKWNMKQGFNQAFVNYYFRHPAYRDYPVVNLTRQQAEKYCEWLSEIWRKNTGNPNIVFRLPTRAEFLRAANGEKINRPYAWDGPYIRNQKGAYLCNHFALDNVCISRDTTTGELKIVPLNADLNSGNGVDITAPSISYYPNEFKLYNLNGNVAEMVSDGPIAVGGSWYSPGYDVRNQSIMPFKEASPFVGFRPVMTFIEKLPEL